MPNNPIEISPVTGEDLRADHSGVLIEQIAKLAFKAFREPPWHDDHAIARLHFGVGVDLMRRNAAAFLAREKRFGRIVGYSVGYEVLAASDDPRDLTLEAISGTTGLNYFFADSGRVSYWDTLCVDLDYRRRHIGCQLGFESIVKLREAGFAYQIARTDQAAYSMRRLLAKLGFNELSTHDAKYPSRTYWALRL